MLKIIHGKKIDSLFASKFFHLEMNPFFLLPSNFKVHYEHRFITTSTVFRVSNEVVCGTHSTQLLASNAPLNS